MWKAGMNTVWRGQSVFVIVRYIRVWQGLISQRVFIWLNSIIMTNKNNILGTYIYLLFIIFDRMWCDVRDTEGQHVLSLVRCKPESHWTTTPTNIYHPSQISKRCIVESFNSWLTVPLGVVVREAGLTSL